ncbi:MAG: hypothetical protein ACYDC2_10220 [Solirubrobacteraceae bacterium]
MKTRGTWAAGSGAPAVFVTEMETLSANAPGATAASIASDAAMTAAGAAQLREDTNLLAPAARLIAHILPPQDLAGPPGRGA